MKSPTPDEVFEEDVKEVYNHSDTSWRHGTQETLVVHREEDNTYWEFHYLLSGDGEYNGLRDEDYSVHQVEPYEETVTRYRPVKK